MYNDVKMTISVAELECSFEDENVCEWNQDGVFDDMDWTPHRGATPSRGTGPDTAPHINGLLPTQLPGCLLVMVVGLLLLGLFPWLLNSPPLPQQQTLFVVQNI